MTSTNPNDPIHPLDTSEWPGDMQDMPLTKREHFAAEALKGMLANAEYWTIIRVEMERTSGKSLSLGDLAVIKAGELIKALNKEDAP
jgi:hypothetical protein